ncbi:hypothetical protein F4861DRAFT_105601 [Xylaria intraflava]|nr:hypothetical protein F4861DRAFT_105601 [Xylaria intraflava]
MEILLYTVGVGWAVSTGCQPGLAEWCVPMNREKSYDDNTSLGYPLPLTPSHLLYRSNSATHPRCTQSICTEDHSLLGGGVWISMRRKALRRVLFNVGSTVATCQRRLHLQNEDVNRLRDSLSRASLFALPRTAHQQSWFGRRGCPSIP